jgi:hypothetical protein
MLMLEIYVQLYLTMGMSNDNEEACMQEMWVASTQTAESDTVSLGHGLSGSGGTTQFTISTPAKTNSLLALTMIDPAINSGWFEIVKATNKSATSIQDLFHNTWLACYPRP